MIEGIQLLIAVATLAVMNEKARKRQRGEAFMGDRYYTVKEAAELYFQGKVSQREVYSLFSRGDLRGFRVGAKILIYESSLEAYRSGQENHAAPAPLPIPSHREISVPPIRLTRLPE